MFGLNAFRVLQGYGVYEEFVDDCSMKLEPLRIRKYNHDAEVLSETSPDTMEKLYGYWFVGLGMERSEGGSLMGMRIDALHLFDLLFFLFITKQQ